MYLQFTVIDVNHSNCQRYKIKIFQMTCMNVTGFVALTETSYKSDNFIILISLL